MTKHIAKNLQQWSKAVREIDGYACAVCGNTEKLEAHHIIPKSQCSDEETLTIENGVTVCHCCHLLVSTPSRRSLTIPDFYKHLGQTEKKARKEAAYRLSLYLRSRTIPQKIEALSSIIAIQIKIDAESYEAIKDHTDARGESLNGFINRAIDETMQREKPGE